MDTCLKPNIFCDGKLFFSLFFCPLTLLGPLRRKWAAPFDALWQTFYTKFRRCVRGNSALAICSLTSIFCQGSLRAKLTNVIPPNLATHYIDALSCACILLSCLTKDGTAMIFSIFLNNNGAMFACKERVFFGRTPCPPMKLVDMKEQQLHSLLPAGQCSTFSSERPRFSAEVPGPGPLWYGSFLVGSFQQPKARGTHGGSSRCPTKEHFTFQRAARPKFVVSNPDKAEVCAMQTTGAKRLTAGS